MQTIQLVLSDASYAKKLKQLLADNGNWPVTIKDVPAFQKGGVVVLDEKVLASLSSPPDFPDRVVLVTNNNPELLSNAWDLGIRSVVFHTDSASTTLLAIMAAYLRVPKAPQPPPRRGISPSGPNQLVSLHPQTGVTTVK